MLDLPRREAPYCSAGFWKGGQGKRLSESIKSNPSFKTTTGIWRGEQDKGLPHVADPSTITVRVGWKEVAERPVEGQPGVTVPIRVVDGTLFIPSPSIRRLMPN